MPKCADCFHNEENHTGGVCSGSLECMCPRFNPPTLALFAQKVENVKAIHKSIYERCKFILENIPPTRNAGEKSFAKIYREIWYGFKIRAEGTTINLAEWKRMPHDDDINREKRRVKQHFPELKTYSKEVLIEQTAIYQALMELAIE